MRMVLEFDASAKRVDFRSHHIQPHAPACQGRNGVSGAYAAAVYQLRSFLIADSRAGLQQVFGSGFVADALKIEPAAVITH